jgi:MYXO-CTERM domain-containing protein
MDAATTAPEGLLMTTPTPVCTDRLCRATAVGALLAGVSALGLAASAQAAELLPSSLLTGGFTAGDLVLSVYGNGAGTGTYLDNQASPITLHQVTTTGASAGMLVLPQTSRTVGGTQNAAISGEYGSSSEGTLQRSADGHSLVIAGYGVNAQAFNTNNGNPAYPNFGQSYGGATKTCDTGLTCFPLAQTASVPGTAPSKSSGVSTATVVPRVVALIGANGSVDTSTALTGVFNENNPRSVATVNGSSFYISGQGQSGDSTSGVFYAQRGASTATSITGNDAGGGASQDTRTVSIYNDTLYVSTDSKSGSTNRDYIGTLGTPGTLPTQASGKNGPAELPGFATATGKVNVTNSNGVNTAGEKVNISPENFFFANPDTLYVADSGNPKNDSTVSTGNSIGDGGLQKWSFINGSWTLDYTLYQGLSLVPNTASSGTTGLIGLTGEVVGGTVDLFATNATIGDEDQTYLFGISDMLAATAASTADTERFTTLDTAAPDTVIRGVAFAPVSTVPVPASLPLFGTALLALVGFGRWRRRNGAAAA